jgi:hypothetical protein
MSALKYLVAHYIHDLNTYNILIFRKIWLEDSPYNNCISSKRVLSHAEDKEITCWQLLSEKMPMYSEISYKAVQQNINTYTVHRGSKYT